MRTSHTGEDLWVYKLLSKLHQGFPTLSDARSQSRGEKTFSFSRQIQVSQTRHKGERRLVTLRSARPSEDGQGPSREPKSLPGNQTQVPAQNLQAHSIFIPLLPTKPPLSPRSHPPCKSDPTTAPKLRAWHEQKLARWIEMPSRLVLSFLVPH